MPTLNNETTLMRYIHFFGKGLVGRIRLASLAVLATALACNTDKFLQVTDPDVARPDALVGAAALPTLRAGAIGNFGVAYNGGASDVEQVHLAGLVSDEFINTETFPTRIEIDQRAMTLSNTSLIGTFFDLTRARASSELAIRTYKDFAKTASDSTGLPEVLALNGLSYILFAENYCGAVPVSFQAPDGSFTFGGPESTNTLLDSAVSKFTQAIAIPGAPLTATFKNLASVGKGRALLDKGDYAGAAAAVTAVPTTFQYNYLHSETTARQNNGTWSLTQSVGRFGEADSEAGIGLPFASDGDLKRAGGVIDPRVADSLARRGSNGSPKGFDGATNQMVQAKYPVRSSAITVADGVEARLIEAEAALSGGDPVGALNILNALRSNTALLSLRGYTANSLPPLTLQPTTAGQIDQVFHERAYWLYLTSHRLGDLRRLVRQYNRPVNTVFPNGPYFKGGTYGTDVNVPVPQQEQNNPNYTPGSCKQDAA
jgi:starch-binding outer membrane protein, SusD/RagB family